MAGASLELPCLVLGNKMGMRHLAIMVEMLVDDIVRIMIVGGALPGCHNDETMFADHHHLAILQLMHRGTVGVVFLHVHQHKFVLWAVVCGQ